MKYRLYNNKLIFIVIIMSIVVLFFMRDGGWFVYIGIFQLIGLGYFLFMGLTTYVEVKKKGLYKENIFFKKGYELNWEEIKYVHYEKHILGDSIIFASYKKRFSIVFQKNEDQFKYEAFKYIPEDAIVDIEYSNKYKKLQEKYD